MSHTTAIPTEPLKRIPGLYRRWELPGIRFKGSVGMAVVWLINWDFLFGQRRSVRPKLKGQRRAPNGTTRSGFLFCMVTQALQGALEPLACRRL